MSVDKMLREMVADEVARALVPVQNALAGLQQNSALVARLAEVLGQPIRRGPGRPRKVTFAVVSKPGPKGRRGPKLSAGQRACAIIGCGRPARSKGYCAAHYQKFRMLDKSGRLPSGWKADAAPGSVENIALPRGRAGAKALAEFKKR